MKNIRLTLQYDGTDYSGWQIQDKERTIQGVVEEAVFNVIGERARITGASRTDAGVHAIEQVASFRTHSNLKPDVLNRAINANIPHSIRVIDVAECSADFHPRYSAKSKKYSYIISRTDAYSVFLRGYSWLIPYQLNSDSIKDAAKYLKGEHDFSSFRGSGCASKNPVRKIFNIRVSLCSSINFMSFKFDVAVIKISIEANAFLRHMVRNIVGTLVEVGRGKILPSDVAEILRLKDRRCSGPTAPGCGLFLEKIVY